MPRASLWNNENQKQYQAERDRSAREVVDRRRGAHTAAALDDIWAALAEDERAFMEYLVLSNRRTAIARRETDLLFRLIDKGLLQLPVGVSKVFMEKVHTAYGVPEDVWRAFAVSGDRYVSPDAAASADRLAALEARFHDIVEALIV